MDELKGIQTDTPLSKEFFSRVNIDTLQATIRYQVWIETKQVIGNQSEDELKVVMRSIYLQNAKHQPNNIILQVRNLNILVVEFCVKGIVSEVKQFIAYNQHINQERSIPDHSVNTSIRGSRQLQMNPW